MTEPTESVLPQVARMLGPAFVDTPEAGEPDHAKALPAAIDHRLGPNSNGRRGRRHWGRPPKLTPKLIDEVSMKIAAGVPFDTACRLSGVSDQAGRNWIEMARTILDERAARVTGTESTAENSALDVGTPRISASLFLGFFDAVERARATNGERRLARITQSAAGGAVIYERTTERVDEKTGVITRVVEKRLAQPAWTADAWVLGRSAPDRWGRRDLDKSVTVNERPNIGVEARLRAMSPEVRLATVNRYLTLLADAQSAVIDMTAVPVEVEPSVSPSPPPAELGEDRL